MRGIYLLEVDGETAIVEEAVDDVQISSHAITGLASATTMHLGILIAGLRALVDSGSTHCFVATPVALRLGLVPTPRLGMMVGVANGDRVARDGVCAVVPVRIGDEHFSSTSSPSRWVVTRSSWGVPGSAPSDPSCGTSTASPCPSGTSTTAFAGSASSPPVERTRARPMSTPSCPCFLPSSLPSSQNHRPPHSPSPRHAADCSAAVPLPAAAQG